MFQTLRKIKTAPPPERWRFARSHAACRLCSRNAAHNAHLTNEVRRQLRVVARHGRDHYIWVMPNNPKQTSSKVATLASECLQDGQASRTQKTLAASALAQRSGAKQTSAEVETLAATVLSSEKYSDETKTLAASVVAQANRERRSR